MDQLKSTLEKMKDIASRAKLQIVQIQRKRLEEVENTQKEFDEEEIQKLRREIGGM